MHGELPVFRRCCFCLPLRYGLIAWGYLKLIADSLFIVMATFSLLQTIVYGHHFVKNRIYTEFIFELVIISTVILMLLADFILSLVFIIGGHMKKVNLLKVFYHYNQVLWVLLFLFTTLALGLNLNNLMRSSYMPVLRGILYFCLQFTIYIANIGVQTYFVLLLRSEIIKLSTNCHFRFVNNAAEAECIMTNKSEIANEQKEIEAV